MASQRTEHIRYLLEQVEAEVAKLYAHVPETVRTKEAELGAEERRLANFVDFIGEGRGSQALAKALVEAERRVEALREERHSAPQDASSLRHQAIAAPAAVLERLGMTASAIARLLGVSDKTVTKAIRSGALPRPRPPGDGRRSSRSSALPP
jgi:excisionase family DNA binding protein